MKTRFVADGGLRIRRSPEMQAKLRALQARVVAKYAAEFAAAGFIGRCRLRCRMALEYWRERRLIVPSRHSLYAVDLSRGLSS